MVKTIAALLACSLSLELVLPAIGGYSYAVGGIVCGLVALLVVVYKLDQEHAAYSFIGGLSLIAGVLVGVFWPAVALAAVAWINAGGKRWGGGAGLGPDDV